MTDLTDKLAEALEKVLRYADINLCRHEETHRGGAIWTICDQCGRKWADDKGGFKPQEDPEEFTLAHEALDAYRAQRDGERFGYRMLEVGEEIDAGDEFRDPFTKVWIKAHLGGVIHPALAGIYRRPLTKGEA